jgi:hypothetical protein
VSVEGHEYHGRGAQLRATREVYVAQHYASWFDFTATDEILGTDGPTDPSPGAFRGFAPDFVYLYRPAKALTVAQLCALATSVAERAREWTR